MTCTHATAAALTRACREQARLYGAEARHHYADCTWADVRPGLELGWARVRHGDTPWSAAWPDVYAGWHSRMPDRRDDPSA